ncbi:hypothetical protein [Burkholderia cepacia]|uniref:hypothetical protein n=1 Tax=Burkholderia cepacia TaxID=292 RepID=UPI0012D97212|nr:hypothetical protein [Burkholderia cepacia]
MIHDHRDDRASKMRGNGMTINFSKFGDVSNIESARIGVQGVKCRYPSGKLAGTAAHESRLSRVSACKR